MKNDKSQFVVRTSNFYLSLFIIVHLSLVMGHLTENPCQAAKNFRVSSIDEHRSVFMRVHLWFDSCFGCGWVAVQFVARLFKKLLDGCDGSKLR